MRFPRRAIYACALLAAGSAAGTGGEMAWPVALAPGVSSGFCDYRDGRFHAGIDVRTLAREGVACRAVADGWVSRIRASSRGYGMALHITLDSGVQALYAHLSEFVPALEDTLWVEQRRAGAYAVDFALPPGRFRVRRGDIVAYSGSTGATAPHLHFEIRTLDDEPLNPLANGLKVADDERPSIARVAFVPLSAGATVEGRAYPLELEPRRVGPGRYRLDDTLSFSGDVGVAASVTDRLNGRSGRLTPHELQVWSDGTRLARVTFDRFGFDEVRHVDFAMVMGALRARGTDIYALYQRGGDPRRRAEFVRGGRICPAPSTRRVHEGRVVALDVAGNRSEVAFIYMESAGVPGGRRLEGARWRASHLAVDLDGSFFNDDFAVVLTRDPRHLLTERSRDDGPEPVDTVIVRAADLAGRTRSLADANPGGAPVTFAAVRAGEAGAVVLDAGLAVEYAADAWYGDAVVFSVDEGKARADRQRSLAPRSPAVRVGPAGLAFKRPSTVRLAVDSPGAADGVFRANGNGGPWSYLPTRVESGALVAPTDRPGVFAVFRDEAAPWIGTPRFVAAAWHATGETRREIHVPVDDEGSGFDDARTEVFLGGAKQIWRFDLAAKKIVVALRDDSIIGPQPVRVVAFDRIGNSSSADYTVTIEAR